MLEFNNKRNTAHSGDHKDVSVTFSRKPNGKNSVHFVFRNGTADKIAPNTSAAIWAIDGSRLYFKEESVRLGYILTINMATRSNNRYMKITIPDAKSNEWFEKHEGSYDLIWDTKYEL